MKTLEMAFLIANCQQSAITLVSIPFWSMFVDCTNTLRNMSVQYTAIFHGCKNDNFQMKIFNIFLIFAQNIDCGYTLEPPQ